MVTKFVLVPNPGERAGVVQFYGFIPNKNPGGVAGFVTIFQPRFKSMVCFYFIS
jgi:hypothetical protein